MKQADINKFLKQMGWDKTSFKQLVKFFNIDVKEFNHKKSKHKLIDLYFEINQMAIKKKINLDNELKKHMKHAKKQYGVKK